jgi:antitoxin ParD1/3/4
MKKRSASGIALTPVLEKDLERLINEGRYRSRSEAVREGVRLLIEREKRNREELKRLKADIAHGIAQLDRGQLVDGDEYMRKWAEREKRAIAALNSRKRRRRAGTARR